MIPLKVTTDYTLLSSLIKVPDLINFCVSKNIKSCAICDKNLYGSIEFYNLCKKNNIKPIIGLEITINNNSVYLYAENYEGYKNMLKINTIISEREITIDELIKYKNSVLLIIPYSSKDLYNILNFYNNKFMGYKNEEEYKNSLLITNNVVFVYDIKVLNINDLKYTKYLDKLSEKENDYNNSYYNYDNLNDVEIERINNVVNLLNLEIPTNKRYIPKYKEDINSYEYLSNLAILGLKKRLENKVSKEYLDRLKYELSVINKMGFVDYFLIVYDYVLYAKKNNILVGPGRGSAAGSLVSYSIGITDIDPVKYNLLFERFLNYERVSMPDIDIDFDSLKREEVINYVKSRYGELNVSGGMTFTTLKTKLVLKEIGKILNIEERLLNKFLKNINRNITLKDNLNNKNIVEYLNRYPEIKKLYDISIHLEGLKKNISTHAAGIVIGDRRLDEIIPMYKNNEVYLTGVDMSYLENLGLLKMDFLAVKDLSTISNIINKIPNFKLNNIPLDDESVYKLFSNADTDGIFQFKTFSFKSILPKFKPQNFSELVALIALNRPGPSRELETYIKRKENKEKVDYYDERLKDILLDTYGVIIYQEQVISILVKMAKFSYAEADNIRRAMAKKKESIIIKTKDEFIKRSINNNYSKDLAENIYNHILRFASYGFNKAHSVSYACVSYWMAYLKVHYNHLFTFEMLNNSLGDIEEVKELLNNLKRHNLFIMPVSINYSTNEFVLKNKYVFMPFKLIKNFKSDIVAKILEERKKGIFKDIYDFFKRTNKFLTKNDYMLLINASCLKEFKYNINTLISNLDSLINYGNLSNDLGEYALIPEIEVKEELSIDNLRSIEINSYGFYLSNHPASKYSNVLKINNIDKYLFKNVLMYVLVENIRIIKTKKNEDMAFMSCSDETGIMDFTIFPKNFNMLQNIRKNDMIKVWGTVSKRYDKISIVVNNVVKDE